VDSNVGGLIGKTDSSANEITSSYWDTSTSGQTSSAGGTGVTTLQMQTLETFTGWDISNKTENASTWYIDQGKDYPRLRVFLSSPDPSGGGGSTSSGPANLPEPLLSAIRHIHGISRGTGEGTPPTMFRDNGPSSDRRSGTGILSLFLVEGQGIRLPEGLPGVWDRFISEFEGSSDPEQLSGQGDE
jgi:hypothetical protein